VEEARSSLGRQTEAVNASWTRIHSLGSVHIGDDVEIGANTCIDRGTIRSTRIGNRTKLDNLVHIGHNVEIGEDTLLCGQVGIAGSTRVGNRVVMGGQCGVSDNIFVGDDVVAGGATKMMSKVPAGRVMLGYPAMKMEHFLEASRNWRRLPRLMDDIKSLKESVSNAPEDD
jgi:UDP-3-O-[3-hydroxymyristoyl] glucosamine N-acyltransferase